MLVVITRRMIGPFPRKRTLNDHLPALCVEQSRRHGNSENVAAPGMFPATAKNIAPPFIVVLILTLAFRRLTSLHGLINPLPRFLFRRAWPHIRFNLAGSRRAIRFELSTSDSHVGVSSAGWREKKINGFPRVKFSCNETALFLFALLPAFSLYISFIIWIFKELGPSSSGFARSVSVE